MYSVYKKSGFLSISAIITAGLKSKVQEKNVEHKTDLSPGYNINDTGNIFMMKRYFQKDSHNGISKPLCNKFTCPQIFSILLDHNEYETALHAVDVFCNLKVSLTVYLRLVFKKLPLEM